jgi:hypothetical protein
MSMKKWELKGAEEEAFGPHKSIRRREEEEKKGTES